MPCPTMQHPSPCTKQLQHPELSSISLTLSILSVVSVYPEGAVPVGEPVSWLRPYNAGGR